MLRIMILASVLAVLAVPALAQEQRYPKWMMDGALPVEPQVPVLAPAAPAQPHRTMSSTNQFRPDAKPRIGAQRPMYGAANSLHMERNAPPPANQPIRAPSQPR